MHDARGCSIECREIHSGRCKGWQSVRSNRKHGISTWREKKKERDEDETHVSSGEAEVLEQPFSGARLRVSGWGEDAEEHGGRLDGEGLRFKGCKRAGRLSVRAHFH